MYYDDSTGLAHNDDEVSNTRHLYKIEDKEGDDDFRGAWTQSYSTGENFSDYYLQIYFGWKNKDRRTLSLLSRGTDRPFDFVDIPAGTRTKHSTTDMVGSYHEVEDQWHISGEKSTIYYDYSTDPTN